MADLELIGISKLFGGQYALKDVSMSCNRGEVRALLGENGAGKSTLLKVLAGAYSADSGSIHIFGKVAKISSPKDAMKYGIGCVYQELSFIPDLTVAQNIFIGRYPRTKSGRIDRKKLYSWTRELLKEYEIDTIDPETKVGSLSLSKKQMIEIIKILSKDPEIVILDEATSALAENRVKWLLCLARKLANKGKIVIFISHRMSEITDCCDNITILRNGVVSGNLPINKDLDLDEVVSLMLGRKLESYYPKIECHTQQSQLLELHDVHYRSLLNHIDFVLHHGEVLGLGGLAGQGQAELLLGLYGICRLEGQVRLNRKAISINSPKEAISHQIALIPEERGIQGLFLRLGIDFNISIPSVDSLSKFGVVDELKEEQLVDRYMKALSIKAQGRKSAVQELSGGNQQKVVMAKIMSCNPELYLMHDITRGVDVGTKREMFNIVRKLAFEGCGILYFSTDVDELVHVCDRVLVMQDGYVRANLEGNEITKENIIGASIGVYKSGAKNE